MSDSQKKKKEKIMIKFPYQFWTPKYVHKYKKNIRALKKGKKYIHNSCFPWRKNEENRRRRRGENDKKKKEIDE